MEVDEGMITYKFIANMLAEKIDEYNELSAKLIRIEEIAKTSYPDYEMQLADIIKECE